MLILVGCNHRSAPVAFREQLAFRSEEIAGALDRLRGRNGIDEAVILSTCNRVEVLARGDHLSRSGVDAIQRFLSEERGVPLELLERYVYHVTGRGAVQHLFEVAAGLDSMIAGEPQVLGQVKQAYLEARRAGALGPQLERLLQRCLVAGKRIRRESGISRNPVSVAYAAVGLARQILGELRGRRALLIGAGKMTHLVARHLVSHGVNEVSVISRTQEHAVDLAGQCGGRALSWDDGLGRLNQIDIVVSCTASPGTVLDRERVAAARRGRKGAPLFIIDIAVPRDVDPAVGDLDDVHLYDIDGLQGIVDGNVKERRGAAVRARRAIGQEVDRFERWRESLDLTPTIVSLRESLLALARSEVERFRARLGPLSPEQEGAVDELSRGLVQKILHQPVTHLRRSVDRGDIEATTALYRDIFGLEKGTRATGKRPAAGGRGRAALRSGSDGSQSLPEGGKDG